MQLHLISFQTYLLKTKRPIPSTNCTASLSLLPTVKQVLWMITGLGGRSLRLHVLRPWPLLALYHWLSRDDIPEILRSLKVRKVGFLRDSARANALARGLIISQMSHLVEFAHIICHCLGQGCTFGKNPPQA